MIDISIEGRRYLLPENWQEISRKDLMIISELYTRFYSQGDFLRHALIRMLGIRKYLVPFDGQMAMARGICRILPLPALIRRGIKRGRVKVFPQEDLFVLSEMLSWILTPAPSSGNSLTKNLLPGIAFGRFPFRKRVFGPEDYLKDVTGIEYAKAETAFLSFCNTRDRKYLEDLVGVLYRPRKRFFRIRRLFSDKVISFRMDYNGIRFGRASYSSFPASIQEQNAVFLFFQGCRNDLLMRYPFVFSSSGGENPDSTGWAGVFRALTNENIVDIQKVMELPIHTILFDLNEKIKLNKQKPEHHG